jgi:crotonobetainyl-CoA:carnitine CoA-transferase CaiB-like acyl-CoA transferase
MPFRFSATPTSIRRAPPTLSQHTDEVLRDELGYTAERLAALRRDGVI